ncbi:MAG: hypothetical protein II680_02970 [Clostridia bacterium]|nr:hypothetical protein [Clostridia bacterium]
MNVTIKRILAALGAAFISVSLGLPASAVQVNEDPDREFFGQYYDEGDPSTIYWVGHELLGDSFWAKQSFDAYWSETGMYHLSTPEHGRNELWQIANSYCSGYVRDITVYNPTIQREQEKYSQYKFYNTFSIFVYTNEDWELVKQSETTEGAANEVVYTGYVNSGDTIKVCVVNVRNNKMDSDALRRLPLNDPSYRDEQRYPPTENSAMYSNVRAVRKNGKWAEDAEQFVWDERSGHPGGSAWIYTLEEGDEVVYADCMEKVRYVNELTQSDKIVTIRYRFKFIVRDTAYGESGIVQEFSEDASKEEGHNEGTIVTEGIIEGYDKTEEGNPFEDYINDVSEKGSKFSKIVKNVVGTVGGAAVIGAMVGSVTGGGGDKGGDDGKEKEGEKKEKEKDKVSYRLYVGKNFGNGLKKGDTKSNTIIYAKIKAFRSGYEIPNDPTAMEMTRRIQILDYLDNVAVAEDPIYNAAQGRVESRVYVPEKQTQAKSCQISVCFVGKGGKYREHIKFKVYGDPWVEFLNPGPGTREEGMALAPGAIGPVRWKPERDNCLEYFMFGDPEPVELHVRFRDLQGEPKESTVSAISEDGAFVIEQQKLGPAVISQNSAESVNERMTEMLQGENTWEWKFLVFCRLPKPESGLGKWPDLRQIRITVTTSVPGEKAEAVIKAEVFPKGIWFDAAQVREKWVRKDRIVVDTLDYIDKKALNPKIWPAKIRTGVAFRNKLGKIDLDQPNEPVNYTEKFFALEPAQDPQSRLVLDPSAPKLTHRIHFDYESYIHAPDSAAGQGVPGKKGITAINLETLTTPMVEDPNTEYQGTFTLGWDKPGMPYEEGTILFGFTGISEQQNDLDIREVRRKILLLIQVMQLQGLPEVDETLEKFGPRADLTRKELGPADSQNSLKKHTVELLMEVVNNPETTRQRLIHIHYALFCAGKYYWEGEYKKGLERAACYDWWIGVCETTRWMCDMAFAALWYAVCTKYAKGDLKQGAKIAAVTLPMMQFIIKYVLAVPLGERDALYYCLEGDARVKSEAEIEARQKELDHQFEVALWQLFEDTAFATVGVIVFDLIDKKSAEDWKSWGVGLSGMFGIIILMMYAKNKTRYPKADQYEIFKAILGDLSLQLLKTFLIGLLLKWTTTPPTWTKKIAQALEKIAPGQVLSNYFPNLKTYLTKFMSRFEAPLLEMAKKAGNFAGVGVKYAVNGVRSAVVKVCPELPSALMPILKSTDNPLPGQLNNILWDYVGEHDSLGTGAAMDRAYNGIVELDPNKYIFIPLRQEAETVWAAVPLFSAVSEFVDDLFAKSGLDVLGEVDFKHALPDQMDYKPIDKLAEEMKQIPGAEREVEFLTGKADKSVYDNGGYEKGMTVEGAMRMVLEEIENA